MYVAERIQKNLKRDKFRPRKILDACCGEGWLPHELSSVYPKSDTYGLDINAQLLATGISKGYFDNATAIIGDAFRLGEKDQRFKKVSVEPRYRKENIFRNLRYESMREPLKDLDLVTAINPVCTLTLHDIGKIWTNKDVGKKPVPLNAIASAAREGGYVLYSMSVSGEFVTAYGTNSKLTDEIIKEEMEDRIKRGSECNLEFVDAGLLEHKAETGLAVLFKKTK